MTVLLIGFQGQRRLLTGTRDELWREYMHGDGGFGCNGVQPIGWEYWCPQDSFIVDLADAEVPTQIESILEKKGQ